MNASVSWFDETAFDAGSLQVESLDFGLLTGDVVPRDGLQRPLLTSGSPTSAPVAKRASTRPIHITHVHQTVIQASIPVATAQLATTAESTAGLSCLERALSVPQGSVHPSASRWRHRSKAQAAAGIAPHMHDGAMSFGTSMPAPMHAAARDVPMESDDLDLLAMPSPAPVQAACPEPVVPKMSQRVLDLIARGTLQRGAVCRPVVTLAPTQPPPTTQVRRGPVAEAIARIAATASERSEVARRSDQVERDRCVATARLLVNAGWGDRADAIMAAAPHPVHRSAPLPHATDEVVSLRPVSHSTKAPMMQPGQEAAVGAWRGSLVAASSLRPPLAGATLRVKVKINITTGGSGPPAVTPFLR